MNIFSVFGLFFAVFVDSVLATDYCSSTICKDGLKHIACNHSGKFDSTCPADAAMVTISEALKTEIVHGHNEKRNLIAGGGHAKYEPACRMATMQWDNELASLAALNVRQCTMKHDKCRKTDAFKHSGQNLGRLSFYGTPNNTALFQQAIEMWYSEVNNSNMDHINMYPSNYEGPAIGHFTVMMADRNIRVGCAAATYKLAANSYNSYLVACNYATTNMKNNAIYAKCSKAGTSCTNGNNTEYPNLCAKSEVYDE